MVKITGERINPIFPSLRRSLNIMLITSASKAYISVINGKLNPFSRGFLM